MADLTLEQQQAIAIAEAKMKMAESQQPQETTLENVGKGVAGILPSALLGAAKPLAGINQAAWQLAGQVAPSVANMGDWPVQKINEYQQKLNQAAGPVASKFTTEPAALIGENALPMGMMGKAAGAIGQIPSFARALGANALGGAALGYATPEKTGLTPEEFANEKAKTVATSAGLNIAPSVVGKTGSLLGSLLRKETGLATGAGEEAFKQAYKAGKENNPEFVANMRGQAPMEDVLNQAKSNLSNMKETLSKEYRSGFEDISKDKSVLNFDEINNAIKSAKAKNSGFGETKDETANKAMQEVEGIINKWRNKNPAEAHTPEGLDFLKQKIYNQVLSKLDYQKDKLARDMIGDVYHSIKTTISDQAPVYSKVMKGYSEGSDLIEEIQRSLNLGNKSSIATGLNKLQSLMRNNVNTNYGYRQELADKLMKQGGKDLMPALAGQALSSALPRGLIGRGMDAGALISLLTGGVSHLPGLATAMVTTSPRLMGETAYKAGQIAAKAPKISDQQAQLAKLLMIRASQGAGNE